MKWTRLSLFYLVAYLFPSGIGLLANPRAATELLRSNADFGDVLPRVVGMFLVGLGIIIVQLIRYRAEVLYFTTIIVRTFFCACFIWLYATSSNPLFISMLVVVGIGLALTSSCFAIDRRIARKSAA